MVTPVVARARAKSPARPATRRPSEILVGAGEAAFWVPREAAEETVYPLFGLEHAVVPVARRSAWEDLKAWLAVEMRITRAPWSDVWLKAIERKASFFQRCSVVALARPSRSLPAGNVVFESIVDFVSIPERELAGLSPRDRQRVERACAEAMADFADERPLHLLQPVYIDQGRGPRLATPLEVLRAARARHDTLQAFCRDHGHEVPLARSPEHLHAAKADHARKLERLRRRIVALAETRSARAAGALDGVRVEMNRLARSASELELPELGLVELRSLHRWALRLVTEPDPQTWLSTIDPVVVIEEPAWRLPRYGEHLHLKLFRAAVHWDDAGVTLLA